MPYTDTTVKNLVVNVLTTEEYEDIQTPSESELYFITDDTGSFFTTCTLPAFSEAGAQTITVPGITPGCHPILDVYISSANNVSAFLETWAHIYRADTGTGTITFYSDSVTDTPLTIMVSWSSKTPTLVPASGTPSAQGVAF